MNALVTLCCLFLAGLVLVIGALFFAVLLIVNAHDDASDDVSSRDFETHGHE